jgi:hypothetical protein
VDLLLDGGRGAEAVAARREIYERRPIHHDYLKLRHAAQQAGQWADLSVWALSLLRDRSHAEQWYVREPISVLVSENLLDEAWAAAMANPGQVPESQWFRLIEVREKNHPADVIRPYQDLIEIGLERASDKYRYPKAIKTIRALRDSYQRADDEAGFAVLRWPHDQASPPGPSALPAISHFRSGAGSAGRPLELPCDLLAGRVRLGHNYSPRIVVHDGSRAGRPGTDTTVSFGTNMPTEMVLSAYLSGHGSMINGNALW